MQTKIRVRPVARSVVVYDPPADGLPALAVALNGANVAYVEAFATVDLAEAAVAGVYQAAFGGQAAPAADDADLLYGATAIGAFLGITKKQVEPRIARGEIPTFRLAGKSKGSTVLASKTALQAHMAALMAGAAPAGGAANGRRI